MAKVVIATISSGYTSCFTCAHWTGWAEDTSPISGTGTCRRFPQVVQKAPTDWCGEHHCTRGGGSYTVIEDAITHQRTTDRHALEGR